MYRIALMVSLLSFCIAACPSSKSSGGKGPASNFVGTYGGTVTSKTTVSGQQVSSDSAAVSLAITAGTSSDLAISDPDCPLTANITGQTTFQVPATQCQIADPNTNQKIPVTESGSGSVVSGHLTLDVTATFTVQGQNSIITQHIDGNRSATVDAGASAGAAGH